jgi:pantothenate kinase type III
MLLAINANNTNTVFAIWDGAVLKGNWRTATEGKRTADEYVVWLDHLLALDALSRGDVDSAVIASVVPEVNFNLLTFCRKYCKTEPLVVGNNGVKLGAKALVDRPEEVGADRLVNNVGLVEGLVGRIKSEFGAPMRTIATGGLAPLFAGATDAIEHVDPDLTLWGLRLIFERNTKR